MNAYRITATLGRVRIVATVDAASEREARLALIEHCRKRCEQIAEVAR